VAALPDPAASEPVKLPVARKAAGAQSPRRSKQKPA
jgi:hypothetical protein